MKILVDADACPKIIKDIIYRAAKRAGIDTILVANQRLRPPRSEYISSILVQGGYNVADEKIVELAEAGDLVITADIPLAALVIEKNALALDPRGYLYSSDTVQQRLSMRNLMDELRSTGIETGGPSSFSLKNREEFANQLDKIIRERRNL